MTEKVADVVQLGPRLEQAARELSAEVVEAEVDNTGLATGGVPRGRDLAPKGTPLSSTGATPGTRSKPQRGFLA